MFVYKDIIVWISNEVLEGGVYTPAGYTMFCCTTSCAVTMMKISSISFSFFSPFRLLNRFHHIMQNTSCERKFSGPFVTQFHISITHQHFFCLNLDALTPPNFCQAIPFQVPWKLKYLCILGIILKIIQISFNRRITFFDS